jgi:hypothetical protein
VREQSAKLQDDLFKQLTSAILQSLVEPEEADGQFCWDEAVSGHLFRALGFLVVQSLLAYSWHQPFNTELMIKSMKFLEEAVLLLNKKTVNFTKKFVPHHSKWLDGIQAFA